MTNEKFKDIIIKYEKLVFTICYQLVRDYGEAQNLVQETFISAYKNIDNCDENAYKPWLCRIAANKSKDYLRSAYFRHTVLEGENEALESSSSYDQPEKEYIVKEGTQALESIIYALKEPYLMVSVMHFIEGRSTEEISEELGRPKKTVQTQLLRAKGFIKEKIRKGV